LSPFVLDCSVAMTWCFADEARSDCDALQDALANGTTAVVPAHWSVEVANAILVGERRSRLRPAARAQFIAMLQGLDIAADPETRAHAFTESLALARQHQLSLYDAVYLELAIRRNLPLATLDGALRQAAQASSVSLLPEKV
jgi:predicted nucleic acid-binding protein